MQLWGWMKHPFLPDFSRSVLRRSRSSSLVATASTTSPTGAATSGGTSRSSSSTRRADPCLVTITNHCRTNWRPTSEHCSKKLITIKFKVPLWYFDVLVCFSYSSRSVDYSRIFKVILCSITLYFWLFHMTLGKPLIPTLGQRPCVIWDIGDQAR